METTIIGGGHVGRELSERLVEREVSVAFLEEDAAIVEQTDGGVDARETDVSDVRSLSNAGVERARTVIVATESDSRNLLIAVSVRTAFETDRLIVLVNHPQNVELFEDVDADVTCSTRAVATALEDVYEGR
jgi:trk system potassium uptake protein TrkA